MPSSPTAAMPEIAAVSASSPTCDWTVRVPSIRSPSHTLPIPRRSTFTQNRAQKRKKPPAFRGFLSVGDTGIEPVSYTLVHESILHEFR
jgi:hypothetical protein